MRMADKGFVTGTPPDCERFVTRGRRPEGMRMRVQREGNRRVQALVLAVVCLGWLGSMAGAAAEPPAAPALPTNEAVRASFDRFARSWLEGLDREGRRAAARSKSHRRFGPEFDIELRPTGRPRTPWVGILRYWESAYRCLPKAACKLAESTPITEVFRYQNGRWVY